MNLGPYIKKLKGLIELEQKEEMKQYEVEMNELTGTERQKKGKALLDMAVKTNIEGIKGARRVTFERYDKSKLPDLEISVGDLIQISKADPLNDSNPTGTVWAKDNKTITLSISDSLPDWVKGGVVRLDLYVNNVTYNRMLNTIDKLPHLPRPYDLIKSILLEQRTPEFSQYPNNISWANKELNYKQKQAVKNNMSADDVALIHGPPGTGKTVTLAETIYQGVRQDYTVLATAASNVAVDNLLHHLIDSDMRVLRLGHPARTKPELRKYTLDIKIQNHKKYKQAEACKQEAFKLIEKRKTMTAPNNKKRCGLSNEEIIRLANTNKTKHGLSYKEIKEMARFIELSNQIDELFDKTDRLEDQAINAMIKKADVICTTNATAGSKILNDEYFDWVIIDEATQATEPSCLIPAIKGKKLIMAGDHKQLPPTIISKDAKEKGLERSLFERLHESYSDSIIITLSRQYRMHKDIMAFPDGNIYNNQLIASKAVSDHTLNTLSGFNPDILPTSLRDALRAYPPVVFIDTKKLDINETRQSNSTSIANPVQAELTIKIINKYVESGIKRNKIGIITPYKDQKERIKTNISHDEVAVDTVDGFQGQEKEIILVDFVRTNSENNIGFLNDRRRLNVALTRARRKLILIGDTQTLNTHSFYNNLIEYIENKEGVFTPQTL